MTWALLLKQGQTHKWCFFMDSYTWTCQFWPTGKTYIHQRGVDAECSLVDLLGTIDDMDGWQMRVRELHAISASWWWWWYIYIYISKTIPLVTIFKCFCSIFVFDFCFFLIIYSTFKKLQTFPEANICLQQNHFKVNTG